MRDCFKSTSKSETIVVSYTRNFTDNYQLFTYHPLLKQDLIMFDMLPPNYFAFLFIYFCLCRFICFHGHFFHRYCYLFLRIIFVCSCIYVSSLPYILFIRLYHLTCTVPSFSASFKSSLTSQDLVQRLFLLFSFILCSPFRFLYV